MMKCSHAHKEACKTRVGERQACISGPGPAQDILPLEAKQKMVLCHHCLCCRCLLRQLEAAWGSPSALKMTREAKKEVRKEQAVAASLFPSSGCGQKAQEMSSGMVLRGPDLPPLPAAPSLPPEATEVTPHLPT